jgi:uncharacterized protein (TIGR03437 family)
VRVNGIAVPLFYVSPTQINFQLPWELAGQTQASVTVTTGSAASTPASLTVAAAGPGVFTTNSSGSGQAAALISGTAFVAAPAGTFPGSRPVSRGEFLSIYCTGLGAVTNQPTTGQSGPAGTSLAFTSATPVVMIGGAPATVVFSGLAPGFVGLYQVDVKVPQQSTIGNQVPITVSVGGVTSNVATIAIQ